MKQTANFRPWCQVCKYITLCILTLLTFVQDLAANMIGRTNARRGARRIFAVLQNRRLNQHIAYTIIDEVSFRRPYLDFSLMTFFYPQVFTALFPESNVNTEP